MGSYWEKDKIDKAFLYPSSIMQIWVLILNNLSYVYKAFINLHLKKDEKMSKWNSFVFVKTQKSWTDTDTIKSWPGVDTIWSTTGEWDWCIKLDENHSTPEKTEEIAGKLRDADWVWDTRSSFWKTVASKQA